MGNKRHGHHRQKPTLAQQLGLTHYPIMGHEEELKFHRMLISYDLGINSEYPERLREYLVETIPQNRSILKYLRAKRKGWHLQGRPLEQVSAFLRDKLQTTPQHRIDELVRHVDASVRRWSNHDYMRTLVSIYEEVRDSDMIPERKRELLNRLADRAKQHNNPHPGDIAAKNYLDLVSQGRKLPTFCYYGSDTNLYIIFGTIEIYGPCTMEFTRNLDGTIRNTPSGSGRLKDPRVQAWAQETLAGSIAACEREIDSKRKDYARHPCIYNNFMYSSNVQSGDWKFSDRQPESENPIELERADEEVMKMLADKYSDHVVGIKEHVWFRYHGITRADKILVLGPGFLESFEGKHPREVAEQLCSDIEEAYSIVKGTSGPSGDKLNLENRV